MLGFARRWSWRGARPDVVAGLAVAAYGVPQVMAYSSLAGLPVQAGLWGLMLPVAVYALLGSSRQLSIGPESTTAIMTAVSVAPLARGDPVRYMALAAAAALGVGLICLVGYFARLGFIAELLSHPVLVGYLAGTALVMIAVQLPALAGVPSHAHTAAGALHDVVMHASSWEVASVAVGAVMLILLYALDALAPKLPGPLIAIVLATVAVTALGLGDRGVAVVGPIPSQLPGLSLPSLSASDFADLIAPALAIALVGYSDTIVTARAFAARHGYDVDANRELLGLGAANLGAGVTQAFPVSSSASRTAIGDALGSKSQRYAVVAAVAVVAVVLVAGNLLAHFPKPALAALVIYAATHLIDVAAFRRLRRFRLTELALAVAAAAGVLTLGILYGVAVAVALSVVELLSRIGRPHDGILGRVPGVAGMHDIDDYPDAEQVRGLLVYRYDAPLFFANAENFRRRALAAVDATPEPVRWFLLNAEANVEVDITAIDALERLREALEHRGITFAMARVKQDLADELERAGFLARVGADRVFPTLPTAVAAYNDQASPDDSPRRAAGSARKGLAPAASGPTRSQNTTPPR